MGTKGLFNGKSLILAQLPMSLPADRDWRLRLPVVFLDCAASVLIPAVEDGLDFVLALLGALSVFDSISILYCLCLCLCLVLRATLRNSCALLLLGLFLLSPLPPVFGP